MNVGICLVKNPVKELFQKICCRQVGIGTEHNVYLIKLVLFQILFVFEKKLARVLKVYSVCACEFLLYVFSDGFKRPYRLPYPVVFIYYVSSVWEIRLGYLGIRYVHIADEVFSSLEEALPQADIVVLALPVPVIIEMLPLCARVCQKGAIVTDIGSIKSRIITAAEQVFTSPEGPFFIGSHPMAGTEKSGVENAAFFKDPTTFSQSFNRELAKTT